MPEMEEKPGDKPVQHGEARYEEATNRLLDLFESKEPKKPPREQGRS